MKTLPTICCTLLLAGGLAGTPTVAFAQEGTYERIVLLEEFMSATCVPCVEVTPIMNQAVDEGSGKAVSIRYHVNQPQPYDPWYKANPADVEARRTYYSPDDPLEPPHTRVDGKTAEKTYIIPEAADRRTVKSPLKIEVTQTPYGNGFNVSVKVTAGENGIDGDYRLRIVAVEGLVVRDDWKGKSPFPGYNGEVEFHDIMRKLVNSADGEAITLMANESKTFTATYTRGADWQANQMYTVAFVQNDDNGEVIQTGYSPKSTSGITEQHSVRGFSFSSVVPNPANNTAVLSYTLGSAASVAIEVRSILGQQVMRLEEGAMEAGSHRKGIDLSKLTAGSYIVTLRAGDYVASEQLAVVK
ncbi:MAG: Omp28-related outer membrane protein [Chlorobi bacterium]|nr:Omp28-related outer membrane protein [Chlorobiota bacterium]